MVQWNSVFPGAVTVLDDSGTVLDFNTAAERLHLSAGRSLSRGQNTEQSYSAFSQRMLTELLTEHRIQAGTVESSGELRFVYQAPWGDGVQRGYLELSLPLSQPLAPPHAEPLAPVQPVLVGPGLTLRPLAPGDAERLVALSAAASANYPLWSPSERRLSATRRFIASASEDWQTAQAALFAIAPAARSEELLGVVGLRRDALDAGVAELGYWVGPDHQGQGLGTRAVQRLLAFAFVGLELRRVQASVLSTNQPSLRLLSRLGFVKEGCRRSACARNGQLCDLELWGLLASEHHALASAS